MWKQWTIATVLLILLGCQPNEVVTNTFTGLEGSWYTIFFGKRCNQNGKISPCYSETIQFEGSNVKRAISITDYSSEDLNTFAIFSASGSFSVSKVNSGSDALFQVDYKLTPTLMMYPELSYFDSSEVDSFEVGKETVFQRTYSIVGDNLTLINDDGTQTRYWKGVFE